MIDLTLNSTHSFLEDNYPLIGKKFGSRTATAEINTITARIAVESLATNPYIPEWNDIISFAKSHTVTLGHQFVKTAAQYLNESLNYFTLETIKVVVLAMKYMGIQDNNNTGLIKKLENWYIPLANDYNRFNNKQKNEVNTHISMFFKYFETLPENIKTHIASYALQNFTHFHIEGKKQPWITLPHKGDLVGQIAAFRKTQ
jgi:hypothetical protein